jgi:transcriptional regulator with XRE-family HTH domain
MSRKESIEPGIHGKLKKLRKMKGLKQQELADRLGIHRSTYSGYETGKSGVGRELMIRLADFYGMPLDAMLDDNIVFPDNVSETPLYNTRKDHETRLKNLMNIMTPEEREMLLKYGQFIVRERIAGRTGEKPKKRGDNTHKQGIQGNREKKTEK